jgi:phage tail sheath protein FI
MPIAVTYPGVYVEELESGPQGITPVATNIGAFVGRAPFGPVDRPVTIFNYGDFTRFFGGLQFHYPLSYSVRDFFANGGSEAIIARLFQPVIGDGVAQLKFPPAPPALPEDWLLDADTPAGATTLTISPPTGESEGDPDIGLTLTFGGDTAFYVVTNYLAGDPGKKTKPTITILPALAKAYRKCTALNFKEGQQPSGWTVTSQSQAKLTLAGGTGLPSLGQRLTFPTSPAVYTIIAEPQVQGSDLSSMQVTVTVTPTPASGAIGWGSTASISDPVPLPTPVGWEIDQFTQGSSPTTGSITLINGSGAPLVGDSFTIGTDGDDVYVVTGSTPADSKNPATVTFASAGDPLQQDDFCHCCAPLFSRPPPSGWTVKSGAKINDTSLTVTGGQGASGVVDIGDTFTVANDTAGTVYSVRYVDPQSGTVYFLPRAITTIGGANPITFHPPLTLAAASPGKWGNLLYARADRNGITPTTAKQFKEYDLEAGDLFNLSLVRKDAKGNRIATERHLNLTVRNTGNAARYPNRIDLYLIAASNLARVSGDLPATPPGDGAVAVGIGGDDGSGLSAATYLGDQGSKTGIYLLEKADLFNLLCIPPDQRFLPGLPEEDLDPAVVLEAATYCAERRAFYIVDPPTAWARKAAQGAISAISPEDLQITGETSSGLEIARNAAVYFPRYCGEDILMKSQQALFSPSGAVAGVYAATDVARGIWKAPAGTEAGMAGVTKFEAQLTNDEIGELNPLGINCLRSLPIIGPVVWGARTLRGADAFEDAYKYVPVRRLTLFIEESLYRGTQWAVFEPNDEALWSALRLQVGSFLGGLARQGAFYNYAVKCDASTTTPDDIDRGIVNILVQIAPVKPAEFVVLQIQQIAGGTPS